MARYYSGAYGSQDALVTALDSALVAEGWTQDQLDTAGDEAAWHIGSLYVSAAWDGTDMTLHQATGYTGGNSPGAHPDDSGSDHRVRAIGNSGGNYHFFTSDGGSIDYLHGVLEYTSGFYRHFSMGTLKKTAGYTGGEYLYGHEWDQGGSIDELNASLHSVLFDGAHNTSTRGATVRMLGTEFPNIAAGAKWGYSTVGTVGTDTGGTARYRAQGGMRRGMYVQSFPFITPAAADAFDPGIPIPIIAYDPAYENTAEQHGYPLGILPDMFVGNITNYADEEEKTFGSETWKIFPLVNSSYSASPGTEQSGTAGVWYRKA